ncbi:MAG: hypothetical protein AAGI90_03295 [Chlamydiota bacterium]
MTTIPTSAESLAISAYKALQDAVGIIKLDPEKGAHIDAIIGDLSTQYFQYYTSPTKELQTDCALQFKKTIIRLFKQLATCEDQEYDQAIPLIRSIAQKVQNSFQDIPTFGEKPEQKTSLSAPELKETGLKTLVGISFQAFVGLQKIVPQRCKEPPSDINLKHRFFLAFFDSFQEMYLWENTQSLPVSLTKYVIIEKIRRVSILFLGSQIEENKMNKVRDCIDALRQRTEKTTLSEWHEKHFLDLLLFLKCAKAYFHTKSDDEHAIAFTQIINAHKDSLLLENPSSTIEGKENQEQRKALENLQKTVLTWYEELMYPGKTFEMPVKMVVWEAILDAYFLEFQKRNLLSETFSSRLQVSLNYHQHLKILPDFITTLKEVWKASYARLRQLNRKLNLIKSMCTDVSPEETISRKLCETIKHQFFNRYGSMIKYFKSPITNFRTFSYVCYRLYKCSLSKERLEKLEEIQKVTKELLVSTGTQDADNPREVYKSRQNRAKTGLLPLAAFEKALTTGVRALPYLLGKSPIPDDFFNKLHEELQKPTFLLECDFKAAKKMASHPAQEKKALSGFVDGLAEEKDLSTCPYQGMIRTWDAEEKSHKKPKSSS